VKSNILLVQQSRANIVFDVRQRDFTLEAWCCSSTGRQSQEKLQAA
jgi:hypothetical protein